jgi:large subunit ribosomal protein L9
MKVLFLQDVAGTAYAGDIKEVRPGFARNYLLPKSIAVPATKDQMNRVEGLRTAAARRREATESEMTALAEKLTSTPIVLEARAGRNDRLYGAITSAVVAQEITRIAGRDIDRRRIVMSPIHQLGEYTFAVKLHQGIELRVKVVVTAPGTQPSAPAPAAPAEAAPETAAV